LIVTGIAHYHGAQVDFIVHEDLNYDPKKKELENTCNQEINTWIFKFKSSFNMRSKSVAICN
jgi:hypothetical protein